METKKATINGLAIVGFISLAFLGGMLFVYAAQFVPNATKGIASAFSGVTSIFIPTEGPVVVTKNSTTTPTDIFPVATTTEETVPTNTAPVTPTPTPGTETTEVIEINSGSVSNPNGLPDLTPIVLATGILQGGVEAKNFVATSTITSTDRVAVKFAVENKGDKTSGTNWNFTVIMPTQQTYIFESKPEHVQTLNPGERIEYVIGFDSPKVGSNLPISITVDGNETLKESNEGNNGAFAKVTVIQ